MADQGDFGSSEAASAGGKARAESLSKAERSEIARRAAESRWSGRVGDVNRGGNTGSIPRAIKEAPLKIGNIEFECAVLSDGSRVLSERAFARAIGAKRGGSHWQRRKHNPGGAVLPVFLSANNLRPFISIDLASELAAPTVYRRERGGRANGIKAELIPDILDVWIKADAAEKLAENQKPFGELAKIISRGLTATGLVALIDEATGIQEIRARDYLAKFLEDYVQKEIRKWVKTFPTSFFRQLCRLKNVPFKENMRLPQYFGHIVNDLVYDRLAPGVRAELEKNNPVRENGRRKGKKFQYLTEDIGHPKLLYHLGLLEGTARGFRDGDYEGYYAELEKDLPRWVPMPLYDDLLDVDGKFIVKKKSKQ